MKVLTIVDKFPSAISDLALEVKKYNPHWDISVMALHPKNPSLDQIENIRQVALEADLIDVEYWKSGEKFKEIYPDIWARKRKILCHHNPYDLFQKQWTDDYKITVVKNQSQYNNLPYSYIVPHTVDLNFFKFNSEYTKERTVNMVAARIEGKKGILEIATVCRQLGLKFLLVGRISDKSYFDKVKEAAGEYLEFHENVSREELRDIYYRSAIHVCNSVDDFESGTLPILEAMACGVPVFTRLIGHVPDHYDGTNFLVNFESNDNLEHIKKELGEFMDNIDRRESIREKGWETIKNLGHERAARLYSKLFYKALHKEDLVSVITPTYNRPEKLVECLAAIENQTYQNIEIVIIDSGKQSVEELINRIKAKSKRNIKYIRFEKPGEYTLAEARNRGIIESEGVFLTFCDDRLAIDANAVDSFVKTYRPRSWLWGMKDNFRKGFVENFSFIKREDCIIGGMFCERIKQYGGTTQEVRTRFEKQGISFVGVDGCNATSLIRSKGKDGRREDIIKSKLMLFKMYS